jgi:hypothetical protein
LEVADVVRICDAGGGGGRGNKSGGHGLDDQCGQRAAATPTTRAPAAAEDEVSTAAGTMYFDNLT